MAIGAGGVDLGTLQSSGAAPKLLRASKTFTGAANLGATGVNELFTTTGIVLLHFFYVRCTSDLVDAVDGALFTLGVTGTNNIFTGANFEGAFDLDTIDLGHGLDISTPAAVDGWSMDLSTRFNGQPIAVIDNIIMTISTQAITGGVLEFYVLWRPLSANGNLAIGAGMVAI